MGGGTHQVPGEGHDLMERDALLETTNFRRSLVKGFTQVDLYWMENSPMVH